MGFSEIIGGIGAVTSLFGGNDSGGGGGGGGYQAPVELPEQKKARELAYPYLEGFMKNPPKLTTQPYRQTKVNFGDSFGYNAAGSGGGSSAFGVSVPQNQTTQQAAEKITPKRMDTGTTSEADKIKNYRNTGYYADGKYMASNPMSPNHPFSQRTTTTASGAPYLDGNGKAWVQVTDRQSGKTSVVPYEGEIGGLGGKNANTTEDPYGFKSPGMDNGFYQDPASITLRQPVKSELDNFYTPDDSYKSVADRYSQALDFTADINDAYKPMSDSSAELARLMTDVANVGSNEDIDAYRARLKQNMDAKLSGLDDETFKAIQALQEQDMAENRDQAMDAARKRFNQMNLAGSGFEFEKTFGNQGSINDSYTRELERLNKEMGVQRAQAKIENERYNRGLQDAATSALGALGQYVTQRDFQNRDIDFRNRQNILQGVNTRNQIEQQNRGLAQGRLGALQQQAAANKEYLKGGYALAEEAKQRQLDNQRAGLAQRNQANAQDYATELALAQWLTGREDAQAQRNQELDMQLQQANIGYQQNALDNLMRFAYGQAPQVSAMQQNASRQQAADQYADQQQMQSMQGLAQLIGGVSGGGTFGGGVTPTKASYAPKSSGGGWSQYLYDPKAALGALGSGLLSGLGF